MAENVGAPRIASGSDRLELRWDLNAMSELATALERKGELLLDERDRALAALRSRAGHVELRRTVLASLWAADAATGLRQRRRLLELADSALLSDIGVLEALQEPRRPPLRARAITDISRELDDALGDLLTMKSASARARAELRVATMTLELARAHRAGLVMGATLPELHALQTLDRLIDFLGYEIAKAQPRAAPDWDRARAAVTAIRGHLDESWFGDVRRADLIAIADVISSLPGTELDAVIRDLSESELYRWLRELDGIAGGNLEVAAESELFATIAARASAATLFRLAAAERGGKFGEIAAAVQTRARVAVAMEFIEICAARAASSDEAMLAAVAGLAALRPTDRLTVYASLRRSGLAEQLAGAAREFITANTVERKDPVLVEFFKGIADALNGTVRTVASLTLVGMYDTHEFREAWSRLGGVVALLPQDPGEFVAVVVDIDTMTKNPARWSGGAATDVAMLGIGRLARLGRLGSLAKAAADWLRRLGAQRLGRIGRLEVESGHLVSAVERLHDAATATAVRDILDDVADIEAYTDQLERLVGWLEGLDPSAAISLLQNMAATAETIIRRLVNAYLPEPSAT